MACLSNKERGEREEERKEGRMKERKVKGRGWEGKEKKGKHTVSLLVPFYVPRLISFSYILITLH